MPTALPATADGLAAALLVPAAPSRIGGCPKRRLYSLLNCNASSSHKDTAEGMAQVYERYGISPERIASAVAFAIDQPEDTTINEFTVGPAIRHAAACPHPIDPIGNRAERPGGI